MNLQHWLIKSQEWTGPINMLTIESAEVKLDQYTFIPYLHVNFCVDLTIVEKAMLDNPQHILAETIGNEVIRQTSVWLALTADDGVTHEVA